MKHRRRKNGIRVGGSADKDAEAGTPDALQDGISKGVFCPHPKPHLHICNLPLICEWSYVIACARFSHYSKGGTVAEPSQGA
jgi:hypothetical protein